MPHISQAFRCVDETARRGSIRQAAEALHLTPAAVHQQVRNLEEQVGTPLFERLPRGVRPTHAGEIVLAAIRRGQRDFDNAVAQVEDLRALRRGHVALAVSHSSAERLVPDVLSTAMRSHPGLTYSVRTGSGERIVQWVADGEVDAGFCLRRAHPTGVIEARSIAQQLGVVTPPGHPLAGRGATLRLRDCLDQPLVLMTPDTELRALVDAIDRREHREARPLVETGSVAMLRRLVADGAGIGFLIAENVIEDVSLGRLTWTPLADAGARAESCVYQRAGQTISVATGLVLGLLEAELSTLARRVERSGG